MHQYLLATIALGQSDEAAAILHQNIHIRVHTSCSRGSERAGSISLGGLGRPSCARICRKENI